MDLLQTLILAFIQGLTEFLPVSSSAHLILLPQLMDWQDQGLAFDVAVHVGTLSAVVYYFRHDLRELTAHWLNSVLRRENTCHSRLAWAILWGTVPVGLAGLAFSSVIEDQLRSTVVIAATTILFGLLLGWSDKTGKRQRDEFSLQWKDVAIIGIAQAIALIPGTSRSGITMTAALMLGLTREAAARFSFLLSIPVIILAGGLEGIKLVQHDAAVEWSALLVGTLVSGLCAYLCIHFFLKFLSRMGMLPFVVYRLFLGGVLLLFFV